MVVLNIVFLLQNQVKKFPFNTCSSRKEEEIYKFPSAPLLRTVKEQIL